MKIPAFRARGVKASFSLKHFVIGIWFEETYLFNILCFAPIPFFQIQIYWLRDKRKTKKKRLP